MENSDWKQDGCDDPRLDHTCGKDLSSRILLWALRDAVASRGYYQNGQKAETYYVGLAAEVNAACERHALECDPPGIFLVPHLNSSIFRLWMKLLYTTALPDVAFLTSLSQGPTLSEAPELFPYVSAITHSFITPTQPGADMTNYVPQQNMMSSVTGSAYNPDGALSDVLVVGDDGQPVSSVVTRVRRPDLIASFKDQRAEYSGFIIRYLCADPCHFLFRTETGKIAKVPVLRAVKNRPNENAVNAGGFYIRYDSFSPGNNVDVLVGITPPDTLLSKFEQAKFSINRAIARGYTVALPILLGAAVTSAGLSILLWWRRSTNLDPAIVILIAFFGAAWSARVAMITLFDAAFNASWDNPDYLSPAYSMWVLFLGSCVLLMFHTGRRRH
jgi:hypothetical protein